MEFRHLRYFLVLSDELHFGRAARRLAISQPPLSLNIQQLEASVGAQLFVRSSRAVQLTAAGQAFVPAARALLAQAAEAASLAKDVGQGVAGSLAIGFAGSMLFSGLPAIVERFQSEHPRLRLQLRELSSSEQLQALAQDRLDLGFVHTTRVPPELSQIKVVSQPLMVCLPVGHPLATKPAPGCASASAPVQEKTSGRSAPGLALAQLRGEPFAVVSRAVSPDYHEHILALCADAGFYPELRHELQHWLSVVSLVAQGMGVALVPAALEKSGMVGAVFLPLIDAGMPYDTHCLWKSSRSSAALAAFVHALRGSLSASV